METPRLLLQVGLLLQVIARVATLSEIRNVSRIKSGKVAALADWVRDPYTCVLDIKWRCTNGFWTEIAWLICIFFTKTNALTTISVLKPKDPRATVFAIANMSAIELLFINEGINALFGAETEWCVQGANHV